MTKTKMPAEVKMPMMFLNGVDCLIRELDELGAPAHVRTICGILQREIDLKFDAINKRTAYSAYRAAPIGSEEREEARRVYLDMIGVTPKFRSEKETQTS